MPRPNVDGKKCVTVILASLALSSCGQSSSATVGDAGTSLDSGADSGTTPDSGGVDGGAGDAGIDAGTPGSDAGNADAGATDAGLVLKLCVAASDPQSPASAFNVTSGSDSAGGWTTYACKAPCPGSWAECAHTAYQGTQPWTYSRQDGGSGTKVAFEFVVDQMGGMMVVTPDGTDAVVFHSGTGGTNTDRSENVSALLESQTQARTVHLVWQSGVPNIFAGEGTGWWTRKDASPSDVRRQALRPEAALTWAATQLAAGHRLGTVGCSLGTMATLAPSLWGQLDSKVSYQMVMGGSVFWDINATCFRTQPYASGHCDTDLRPCASSADCVGGPDDHCRTPTDPVTTQFPALLNYLYESGGDPAQACLLSRPASPVANPLFDESSFSETHTRWSLSHPVHFVTDEDGVYDGGGPMRPGDQMVMEGSAQYAVLALRDAGTQAWWDDFNGYFHCDSFGKDPALTAWTAAHIESEMGLR